MSAAVLTPPAFAGFAPPTVAAPPVLPPPPADPSAGPVPLRWSLTDYRRIAETGLFDGLRTMLIDGVILTMPNPKPPHEYAQGTADDWLRTVCPVGYYVRNQQSFHVGTTHDPAPDLAVVPGKRQNYLDNAPTVAVLVIEVAESSLFLDTTTKAELYATAGVPDYWVLDLDNRQLLVFRDPEPLPAGLGATAYRTRLTFAADAAVAPLAAPNAAVRVADLLP